MDELESPKSMQEFTLGAYLQLLMDMLDDPVTFGPLDNSMWNGIQETLEIWWEKYYNDVPIVTVGD